MNSNNYQKIVQAAIWYNKKILLAKRLKLGFGLNLWGDPGGKVNENESLLRAITREIKEETGMPMLPCDFEIVDSYCYPDRKLKTFIFEVFFYNEWWKKYLGENPEPEKHSDWQWFSKEEALKLPLVPSVEYYLLSCRW